MMIVAPIAAMMVQMAISRSREFLADEGAHRSRATPVVVERPQETRREGTPDPDAGVSRHGTHVHREPAHRRRTDEAVQYASADEERVARLEAMVYGAAASR